LNNHNNSNANLSRVLEKGNCFPQIGIVQIDDDDDIEYEETKEDNEENEKKKKRKSNSNITINVENNANRDEDNDIGMKELVSSNSQETTIDQNEERQFLAESKKQLLKEVIENEKKWLQCKKI